MSWDYWPKDEVWSDGEVMSRVATGHPAYCLAIVYDDTNYTGQRVERQLRPWAVHALVLMVLALVTVVVVGFQTFAPVVKAKVAARNARIMTHHRDAFTRQCEEVCEGQGTIQYEVGGSGVMYPTKCLCP